MKNSIYIGESGELFYRSEGHPDIKFRDQEGVADLLFEPFGIPYNRGKSIALHLSQSFDLPNYYTAQVVEECGLDVPNKNELCEDIANCICLHDGTKVKVAVLIPLKQEPKECESSPNGKHKFGEYIEGAYRCCFCGEPGNEAKKEEDGTNVIKIMGEMSEAIGKLHGMDKLVIYRFQAKQIEDTFRLVNNVLESQKKETSLDRDVIQSWQMIKNVLSGKIDEHVSRI